MLHMSAWGVATIITVFDLLACVTSKTLLLPPRCQPLHRPEHIPPTTRQFLPLQPDIFRRVAKRSPTQHPAYRRHARPLSCMCQLPQGVDNCRSSLFSGWRSSTWARQKTWLRHSTRPPAILHSRRHGMLTLQLLQDNIPIKDVEYQVPPTSL